MKTNKNPNSHPNITPLSFYLILSFAFILFVSSICIALSALYSNVYPPMVKIDMLKQTLVLLGASIFCLVAADRIQHKAFQTYAKNNAVTFHNQR